jgi:hypothetical protein
MKVQFLKKVLVEVMSSKTMDFILRFRNLWGG